MSAEGQDLGKAMRVAAIRRAADEAQVRDAVEAVLAAWCTPGRRPGYHRAWVATMRAEWPALAEALDALATTSGRRKP